MPGVTRAAYCTDIDACKNPYRQHSLQTAFSIEKTNARGIGVAGTWGAVPQDPPRHSSDAFPAAPLWFRKSAAVLHLSKHAHAHVRLRHPFRSPCQTCFRSHRRSAGAQANGTISSAMDGKCLQVSNGAGSTVNVATWLAVGETVILLTPPLHLVGFLIGVERGCQ